jgi:large subunit ribosomal protein L9
MKVILQKNVQQLGKVGDVVESKPGYFRNYLHPRGLAVLATEGTLKKRDEEIESLRAKSDRLHSEALTLQEKISALAGVNINQRAGDGGRLYGKVTNKDIADALSQALGAAVDKKGIKIPEQITAVGTYKVSVKVAADVQAELNVIVYDATQGEPPVLKAAEEAPVAAAETETESQTSPEENPEADAG